MKFSRAIHLVVLLIGGGLFAAEAQAIEWKTYKDAVIGIEMPYSADWKIRISQPSKPNVIQKTLWFNITDGAHRGIMTVDKSQGTVEQSLQAILLGSKDGASHMTKTQFKGKEGYVIWERPGVETTIVQDGRYVITISFIAGKDSSYFKPIFSHIREGFKFTAS